ncbi:MFS transporter (macronuclear) [Tetrahymena thermophila SB210]|uniref:MFS transporter n=1 Tax=Tetrahymena thermophila (strain SB210) TaxID=312017 RepID=Q23JP8_TETTS|nr:MFS transporter [Tetrahymena thermophila SB210]EAR96695.3 MFS transporter [Tetrahymena thermophila SB210]|eukprot:XP_001016940.3 MFS transporter [Tetrahymena thermophila SB210]
MQQQQNSNEKESLNQPLINPKGSIGSKYENPPLKTICGFDANLIALSSMNFFQNAAVSIIVPFFPPIAESIGVSSTMIGLILAFNPIGSFLTSLIVGQMMGRLGKKNLMIWGLIFQSLSIASFGALSNLKNDIAFIILSAFSRFIQGAARSAYGSSSFGYVPQLWPDSVQKKISIMETLTALGTILGPILGQVMYTGLGSQMPFYILSFLFLCCLFTIRWLPPDMKSKKDLDRVSSLKCLANRYIFFTFMTLVAGLTNQSYINTLYTQHMKALGLSDDVSGYVYPIGSILYIGCLHVMPRVSKYIKRKLILSAGVLMCVIGVEVIAPEKYLGLPSGEGHWYIVTIGQCLTNIGFAMVVLPIIPELIELILEKELKERKIQEADPKLTRACSDMSSGIFMAGYSLGLFIGPFTSGILYDVFDGSDIEKFMNTSRVIAAFGVVVLFLYFTIGGAHRGLKKLRKLSKTSSRKLQVGKDDEVILYQNKKHKNHLQNSTNSQNNNQSEVITSLEVNKDLLNCQQINEKNQLDNHNNQTQKLCDNNYEQSDILLSNSDDYDLEQQNKDEIYSLGRNTVTEEVDGINFYIKQDNKNQSES